MIAENDFPGHQPVMDTQEQFIVFSPDPALSREVLNVALRLRRQIYRFFGSATLYDQPAFILVFPSRERYNLPGTGGAAVQFKYRGQNVRIIATFLQENLKEEILPHELVHFLISDLATGSGQQGEPPQLPVFINEGIAEYFSAPQGRRVRFEKSVWDSLQQGKLESFQEIMTSTADWSEAITGGSDSWVKRSQAYSAVSFLASLPEGNVKLRNYLLSYGNATGRMARGSASLRAFEMAFRGDYSSWEEIQKRWVGYIQGREFVTVEGESATIVDSSGEKWQIGVESGPAMWLSGGKLALFEANKPGSFVVFADSQWVAGIFDVYGIYARSPQSGRFRLTLSGREFPGTFDGYARKETVGDPVYHGKAAVGPGTIQARLSVTDKAAVSAGFRVGIDCLILRRDRQQEERNRAAAQRYLQAGIQTYRAGQYRESEANLTAGLNLLPGNATTLEWRAHARMALGRLEDAAKDVDAALMLSPQNQRLEKLKSQIATAKDAK
jgi:tetratricopeptide (TPR) repeat protein